MQRAAGDELHGDDRRAFDLLGAIDIDGVRMIDRRREPPLAQEAFARVRRIERMPEHLQRDAPPAREILRFIDRAHAAFAEQAQDPIAAKLERLDRRPDSESAGRRRAGSPSRAGWRGRA